VTISAKEYQWLWQTGKKYYDEVEQLIVDSGTGNIITRAFFDRIDLAFAAADIIISRAGAGTISELCLVGKPVILVPSPNVAGDHQTRNAKSLEERDAALVITDEKAEKMLIGEAVRLISDRERRKRLSENIAKMAERDADIRIANEVLKLLEK